MAKKAKKFTGPITPETWAEFERDVGTLMGETLVRSYGAYAAPIDVRISQLGRHTEWDGAGLHILVWASTRWPPTRVREPSGVSVHLWFLMAAMTNVCVNAEFHEQCLDRSARITVTGRWRGVHTTFYLLQSRPPTNPKLKKKQPRKGVPKPHPRRIVDLN